MAINKRIELTWRGESCAVLVTMEVIERIEECKHLNLVILASELAAGNVKLSHVARLISVLLKEGGIAASADDVYEGMFEEGTPEAAQTAIVLAGEILGAIFPSPKKKSGTSSKKQKAAS